MAVQQKEDRGPKGEACGGEESGELQEGAEGRSEGEAGGQDAPRERVVQGRDGTPWRKVDLIPTRIYTARYLTLSEPLQFDQEHNPASSAFLEVCGHSIFYENM